MFGLAVSIYLSSNNADARVSIFSRSARRVMKKKK